MQNLLIKAGLDNNLAKMKQIIAKKPSLKFYNARKNIFLVDVCSQEIVNFIKKFPIHKQYNAKLRKQYAIKNFVEKYANTTLDNPEEILHIVVKPLFLQSILDADADFIKRNKLTFPILHYNERIENIIHLLDISQLSIDEVCLLSSEKFAKIVKRLSVTIICPELISKLNRLDKHYEIELLFISFLHTQVNYHAFLCTKMADDAYQKIDNVKPEFLLEETFANIIVNCNFYLLCELKKYMFYSFLTNRQYYDILDNLHFFTVDDYILLEEKSNFCQYHNNETLVQSIADSLQFEILKYVINNDAGDLNTTFCIDFNKLPEILYEDWKLLFELFPNYSLDYQEIHQILQGAFNSRVHKIILEKFPIDINRFFMAHILWMKEFDPDIFKIIHIHRPEYKFNEEIWNLICKKKCTTMLECWIAINGMDTEQFHLLVEQFMFVDSWYFFESYLTSIVQQYEIDISDFFYKFGCSCGQPCFEWMHDNAQDVKKYNHCLFRNVCDNGDFYKANYMVTKNPTIYKIDVELDGTILYEIMEPINFIELDQQLKDHCNICYQSSNCLTSCQHIFCWQCLEQWMRRKRSCPLCRTYITTIKK